MPSTYTNDLRIEEQATGENSGTWGTKVNSAFSQIAEAFSYGTQDCFSSDADATTTVADGATDPARAMYFKVTSSATLTATRTLTIAPNTISRVMFIENATTGSQSITISQGSGANVTIGTGKTKVVYLDGAGATAAVVDAMAKVDPGVTDTLAEVLVAGNTSGGTGLTMSSGDDLTLTGASYNVVWDSSANSLAFADNAKATFGAGDLEIYHDGSNSYVDDTGTGNLIIRASAAAYINAAGTNATMGAFVKGGGAFLYHNGNQKFTTTSTGIDVTGTVSADGLTVDGTTTLNTSSTTFANLNYVGANKGKISTDGVDLIIEATANLNAKVNSANRLKIEGNGDISFYEDTGTTAKLFWDASAESLGIGTTSPSYILDLQNSTGGALARFKDSDSSHKGIVIAGDLNAGWVGNNAITTGEGIYYQNSVNALRIYTNGSEAARIDSSGNFGIGTTSPSATLALDKNTGSQHRALDLENNSITYSMYVDQDNSSTNSWSLFDTTNSQTALRYLPSSSGYWQFYTNDVEAMRIDSSGNVSIGTSATSAPLRVNVGTDQNCAINTSGGNPRITAFNDAVTASVPLGFNGSILKFETGGVEAMRIDSSGALLLNPNNATRGLKITTTQTAAVGDTTTFDTIGAGYGRFVFKTDGVERVRLDQNGNLLVGTNSTSVGSSTTEEGFTYINGQDVQVARENGTVAVFNRWGTSADGTIVSFKAAGSAVGNIGTNSGNIYLTDGARSLIVDGSVVKAGYSTGGDADNAQDLGSSSVRWKDLYLSSGVYVGGTGAANHLDDYEEGTFTPTFSVTNATITHDLQTGNYTKVGDIVHFAILMGTDAVSGSIAGSNVLITGLPFTASAQSQSGSVGLNYSWGTALNDPAWLINVSTSIVALYENDNNATLVKGAKMGTSANSNRIYIVGSYRVA